MTVYKFTFIVIIGLFCLNNTSYGQASDDLGKTQAKDPIDSLLLSVLNANPAALKNQVSLSRIPGEVDRESSSYLKDSATTLFTKNILAASKKRPISLNGGYFSYQWIQRTGADTPFIEGNSSQHLLQGSFSAVLADA